MIIWKQYTVVPRFSSPWHLVIRTASSQIPQSKYLYQHWSLQWFTEISQIAKMATKHICTVLDKITICQCLDRDLLRRRSLMNIISASRLFQNCSCNCFYPFVWLSRVFDYLNKFWSQGCWIIEGALCPVITYVYKTYATVAIYILYT